MTSSTFAEKFQNIYREIKRFHLLKKNSGIQIANKYSNQIDKLISSEVSLSYKNKGIALLALGGYGRRELCIQSDIDILILYERTKKSEAEDIAEKILYKLWDTGLEVGNSLRTIDDCLELASSRNSTVLSSLLDLRAIAGDSLIQTKLQNDINKKLLPNISQNFINEKVIERKKRHIKYGSATYLTEPNIKEGEGCLRDIHSIFWILKAFHSQIEINKFLGAGFLNKNEIKIINESLNFLLTIRNHLHINKKHDIDIIDFDSQIKAADFFNIEDEDFLRKETLFMKEVYGTINKVSELTDKIIQKTISKKIFTSKRIQNLDDFFIIHRGVLKAINPKRLFHNPRNILKVFEYSVIHDCEICDDLLKEIKKIESFRFSTGEIKIINRHFIEILKKGKNIFKILSSLNKNNILSFLFHEFEVIKNLPLTDPSHIYTVDVHSILLINEYEKLINGEYKKDFPFESGIASKLKKKEAFYLACLLHDIGKGYGNNHAERGSKITKDICQNLLCEDELAQTVEFLVKEHLIMSSYSQKRDLDDKQLIEEFKNRVESKENLQYLFILTFCDLRSVAPDVWSNWKGNLLSLLFKKANSLFVNSKSKHKTLLVKNTKKDQVFKSIDQVRFKQIAGNYFSTYFNTYNEEELKYQIEILMNQTKDISLKVKYSQKNNVDQVTIWSKKQKVGFAEICGRLSSASINIYSGRTTVLKKNLALYTFEVNRFGKSTFSDRAIWSSIQNDLEKKEIIIEENKIGKNISSILSGAKIETKIKVDNNSSKNYTIIELSSADKPGLLYEISKNLKDLGLSLGLVKISTRRGSVDDSFYVKKTSGGKLLEEKGIELLKKRLKNILI
ncbi:[protein-PII] uridylyltransferase [bacterium]|jgi:[protein-PII] uridylyltransferase|nr:[protein-PII] uridylyltransferase [bacterium]